MITARVGSSPTVLLAAPVRGIVAEAQALTGALDELDPEAIGLGLSEEELRALVDYFVVADGEPVVPLTANELNEVRGLVRFGDVRVPNPAFVEALRWGHRRSVAVAALDPTEEGAAQLFAEHIGYLELVRRTVRERRAGKDPPQPSTPDAFALEWERRTTGGRGSRAMARARDQHLAQEAARLATGRSRVAVVVDRERFEAVKSLLSEAPG